MTASDGRHSTATPLPLQAFSSTKTNHQSVVNAASQDKEHQQQPSLSSITCGTCAASCFRTSFANPSNPLPHPNYNNKFPSHPAPKKLLIVKAVCRFLKGSKHLVAQQQTISCMHMPCSAAAAAACIEHSVCNHSLSQQHRRDVVHPHPQSLCQGVPTCTKGTKSNPARHCNQQCFETHMACVLWSAGPMAALLWLKW